MTARSTFEILPTTRLGRAALWLLLPVLTYPFYWSVFRLVPESWHAFSIGVGVTIVALAATALAAAAYAVVRGERSLALLAAGGLTLLLVVAFGVGEALGG